MQKISSGTNICIFPLSVTLLGTNVKGKTNLMALGVVTRVNASLPMVGCGVGKHHLIPQGIRENQTFSINFPTALTIEKMDYCDLVSGKKVDKSTLIDVFYGELWAARQIREYPLSLESRLVDIVVSYSEEQYLSKGKMDIKKINPLLFTMPDNRHWTIGEYAGEVCSIRKKLKKGK